MMTKTLGVALLATPLFLVANPASAGQNGQQLQVTISSGTGTVKVEGYNQNNEWRTWQSGARNVAYTNNWWWKGYAKVTVTMDQAPWWRWWDLSRPTKTCTYNVPEKQWSDWYHVSCQP
ncbi:hypothetical protein [Microcystis aeruginosa]|nr:hypothetical protein [Microcystis aeruginosa]